jgi:Fe-S-cluster containining protein
MSNVHKNPCIACTFTCCTLGGSCGLMLTKDEFEKHFKSHAEGLLVRVSKKIVIVSSKEGRVCPHLENGGCRIYQDRPIDCRLYPYQMRPVHEKRKKAKIEFNTRSDCPQKKSLFLLMPEAEVRALVMAFGKKVYGENKKIIVQQYEKKLVSRLRNLIETVIGRSF